MRCLLLTVVEILTETKTYIVLSFRISVKPEKVHTKTLKYLLYFSRYNSCDIPPPIMEGGEGGLTETEIRPIFKRIAEK